MTAIMKLEEPAWLNDGDTVWAPYRECTYVRCRVACAAGHSARVVNQVRGIDRWRPLHELRVPEGDPHTYSRLPEIVSSIACMSEELAPNYRIKDALFSVAQFRPNIMPWPKGVRAAGEDGYFVALSGPGTVHPITAGDWVVVNLSSGHMSLYGDSEWKRMVEEKVFEPFTPS